MKVGIPVECQNGHASMYVIEVVARDLDVVHRGATERCGCPKHNLGDGWRATGRPVLISGSD
jgi:hypothetical protein